ncbi:hypothetical protein ACFQY4_21335 [Catellatospora bangladeshensis]|uniref:Uncharacterized protein n=1 Tax=Catellatospora bangladeshensis TaxID=310355 RepID=A0A8J3JWJ0_9ACTN|nr:hypothetical protein [Catellatospora bangladeshensis]GIF84384.1 hypothetical protein Cba03nite_57330 [Catellatospora bangladeshensis]
MSFTKDDGAPADFTAALRAGGYGLPDPATAGHGHAHGTDGVSTSVRSTVHKGHEIRIETTYKITIDGKPLEGGLEVLDNGAVHYHGLPQYALPSAIDMCKRVLDYFGTEPPAVDQLGCAVGEHGDHCGNGTTCCIPAPGEEHGEHQHDAGHQHGEHQHPAPQPDAPQPQSPTPAPTPAPASHDHGHAHDHQHGEGH